VEEKNARNTPHAFSHFSYHESQKEMIVVDIQGVGDLYTDPQIHSDNDNCKSMLGRGNLGVQGVALFFLTHSCNGICKQLDLPPFPMYAPHRRATKPCLNSHLTVPQDMGALMKRPAEKEEIDFPVACSVAEVDIPDQPTMDGKVHMWLFEAYKSGILDDNNRCNPMAALFHLTHAAHEGHPLAQLGLSLLYSGLAKGKQFLAPLTVENNMYASFFYAGLAAQRGARQGMLHLAYLCANGTYSNEPSEPFGSAAVEWYAAALNAAGLNGEEDIWPPDMPPCEICAQIGRLYLDGAGDLAANIDLASQVPFLVV
jgi:hypothetical protein